MDFRTVITESTCGEACWEAREEICRCSCNGGNHGIYRRGERPERTSKINGFVYKLVGVGSYTKTRRAAKEMNDVSPKRVSKISDTLTYTYYWRETDKGAPARVKRATQSQIERWNELANYKANPVPDYDWQNQPYMLWERM